MAGVSRQFEAAGERRPALQEVVEGCCDSRRASGAPGQGRTKLLGQNAFGFRTAKARRDYLTVYEHLRALSPVADVVHDVPTTFGTIRVYQHGPDRGVPIVLLHGFYLTSAMWWNQVTGEPSRVSCTLRFL